MATLSRWTSLTNRKSRKIRKSRKGPNGWRLLRVICLLGLAGALAAPPGEAQGTETVKLLPAGVADDAENPLTLTFHGQVYDDTEEVWLERRPDARKSPVESFLEQALDTYRGGTLEEVLELWLPEDRAGVRELFQDAEVFEQNQAFYRRLAHTALAARVLYGPSYVLLFVQHSGSGFDDFIKVYPLVSDGERFYLTNRLQADPVFTYFANAYKESLPLRDLPQEPANPSRGESK